MYQKILVPLDGSELAECALEHVKAIAKGCSAGVVLFRVVEPIVERGYLGFEEKQVQEMHNETEGYARSYLSKIADGLKKDGVVARVVIVDGKPAEQILDYAGENQVDLIVMSTHGRSGISRWVMGSVADRVLRRSGIPVLAVRPHGYRPR